MSSSLISDPQLYEISPDDNLPVLRTTARGTFTQTGLKQGGQDALLTVDDTAWVKVERSATTSPTGSGILTNRNSLKISNYSNTEIATTINPDPNGTSQAYSVGDKILPNNSQFLDVAEKRDNGTPIDIWVRAKTGTVNLGVFFREIA